MVTVRPANEASWDDVRAVFGDRGEPYRCQCQYFKISGDRWRATPQSTRAAMLRASCDTPAGLLAYVDGEPAGWCAVEPRVAYPRLRTARVPWAGRAEDKDDPGVWSVTCFVTRAGFRRRGVSRALARAVPDFARARGARAVEAYPMLTEPGAEPGAWATSELFVGAHGIFEAAGFVEVSRPTPRRAVMRLELGD